MPSTSRSRRPGSLFGAILAALALVTAAAVSPDPVSAQATGSIRGQVTDAVTARPLAGAQVFVPGTQRGSITNASGQFLILNVPVGAQTVRVENLGFAGKDAPVTVTAGEAAVVNFELSPSAIGLDEIVVTGTAGEQTKRSVGNTVSQINAAAITDVAPISDPQELLQARTPGLTIMSNSGIAGTGSKIRIRGASSLEAGNEPVVYVDGVRITSGVLGGFGTSNSTAQHTSALEAINPDDIESIEVIKGPAAATLYGAEAATGVIQIITKKGRAVDSGIEWTFSGEAGQEEWALERITQYWQCTPANIADANNWPGCQGLDPNAPASERIITARPLDDPLDCVYVEGCQPNALRTADVWGASMSARGGGDRYNFYLSGEKNDEQGIFYNNYSRRTAGRANFGFVPTEQLTFSANVGYTRQHQAIPLSNNSSNSILRNAFRGRPGAKPDWAPGYRNFSPEIANTFDNEIYTERTILGLTATYNPFSWFSNRLTLGLDNLEQTHDLFYAIDQTGRQPWGATNATGTISRFLPETHRYTVDYAGSFNFDINEAYTSSFSAGMQLNAQRFESHQANGEGLVANKLNLVSAAAVTTAAQSYSEQTSLGFFVQEQIGWKNRLFATAAVRVDDNSAFGQDFDLVVYPKAALSYVISDEEFFDGVPYVDDLKLRAAWGQAGNAPSPFSADRTLRADVTAVGDLATNFIEFNSYGNPDLKAETGQEFEFGFDAQALGGRLGAEATYYYKQTKDALIEVPAPRSTGFGGNRFVNIGEIKNSGFELLLHGSPLYTRQVQWDATLSFASNANELVSFGRYPDGSPILEEQSFGSFAIVQKHKEGYPLGGYWSTDVERDASGKPVLDATGRAIVLPASAMEYVGPMMPTREVGFSSTVTVLGNLSLFGTLDYKGGHYQWCAICSIRSRIDLNTKEINDPNTPPEELARLKSLQTKEWIMPADFVKLRELSATYNMPSEWIGSFGAERLSLTVAGRNLWMWTKYAGTSDPEQVFDGNSEFSTADYAGAPMTRRLMISTRVVF